MKYHIPKKPFSWFFDYVIYKIDLIHSKIYICVQNSDSNCPYPKHKSDNRHLKLHMIIAFSRLLSDMSCEPAHHAASASLVAINEQEIVPFRYVCSCFSPLLIKRTKILRNEFSLNILYYCLRHASV